MDHGRRPNAPDRVVRCGWGHPVGDIIRKTKDGRFLGWYVRYVDRDGRRKQRASHQPTKEQARRLLIEIEARIARGQAGLEQPPPPAPTLAALIERFLHEYSRPKIKDLISYRTHARKNLRRALPLLGAKPTDALTTQDIIRLRDSLGRSHAPASVRITLAVMATMFSWAQRQGLVPENPLRGVERPIAPSSIDFFSHDEVERILQVARERAQTGTLRGKLLGTCTHLAIHTGLRKGELLGLRWQDIDFATRRLTVARSYTTTPKSGKPRPLRLPVACIPMLQEWKKECPTNPVGLLFPVIGGGQSSLHNTQAKLGLPRLLQAAGCRVPAHPWHALRHTFASHFIMQGGNILTLQKILGHSDVKMTLIYAHLAPDFLADEMDRLKFRTG